MSGAYATLRSNEPNTTPNPTAQPANGDVASAKANDFVAFKKIIRPGRTQEPYTSKAATVKRPKFINELAAKKTRKSS